MFFGGRGRRFFPPNLIFVSFPFKLLSFLWFLNFSLNLKTLFFVLCSNCFYDSELIEHRLSVWQHSILFRNHRYFNGNDET